MSRGERGLCLCARVPKNDFDLDDLDKGWGTDPMIAAAVPAEPSETSLPALVRRSRPPPPPLPPPPCSEDMVAVHLARPVGPTRDATPVWAIPPPSLASGPPPPLTRDLDVDEEIVPSRKRRMAGAALVVGMSLAGFALVGYVIASGASRPLPSTAAASPPPAALDLPAEAADAGIVRSRR
jgi:hypothetical protein